MMKKEDVEKLLKENGIPKDKIKTAVDSIMGENDKDVEAEKSKTAGKETELTTANATIKDLQVKIKDFDGVDLKKLQEDATALQVKYDTDLAAAKAESEKLKKEYSLKDVLSKSGVEDPDYLIFKHGGVDKFTFDGEGKPVGIDEAIKPYKEAHPHIFKQEKPDTTFKGFKPGEKRDDTPGGKEAPTTLADAVKTALESAGE